MGYRCPYSVNNIKGRQKKIFGSTHTNLQIPEKRTREDQPRLTRLEKENYYAAMRRAPEIKIKLHSEVNER